MDSQTATTIAIQGVKASFHDIAAEQYFDQSSDRAYCESFAAVFDAVETGQADYGICAIENSLAGSINEVYDLLLERKLHIIGETYLKVEQALMVPAGTNIGDIKEVYSHPVALAQCREYLDRTLPQAKRLEYHDTAASAEYIKELGRNDVAAIAHRRAADSYGLEVISDGIESLQNSYTRFIAVAKKNGPPQGASKTSLVLRTSHRPGALHEALGAFSGNDINLSKLQSRPIPSSAWQYMFYVDAEAGLEDERLQWAFDMLKNQECLYTVLGSYRADR